MRAPAAGGDGYFPRRFIGLRRKTPEFLRVGMGERVVYSVTVDSREE